MIEHNDLPYLLADVDEDVFWEHPADKFEEFPNDSEGYSEEFDDDDPWAFLEDEYGDLEKHVPIPKAVREEGDPKAAKKAKTRSTNRAQARKLKAPKQERTPDGEA